MAIQKIERIGSTFFYEHKKGGNVKFPGRVYLKLSDNTSGTTYLFK